MHIVDLSHRGLIQSEICWSLWLETVSYRLAQEHSCDNEAKDPRWVGLVGLRAFSLLLLYHLDDQSVSVSEAGTLRRNGLEACFSVLNHCC